MKPWYQSKTIIANLLAALIACSAIITPDFLTSIGIADKTKFLAIIGASTTALNVFLRMLTSKAIDTKSTN